MSNGTKGALALAAALAAAGAIAGRRRRGTRAQAASLPRGQQGAAEAPELTMTRAGFPWPEDTVLYHGTASMDPIREQGFKTRQQHKLQMAGGRHAWSVSFTLLPERAAAIALGLETMARCYRRSMPLVALLDKLREEIPGLTVQDLTMGFELQNATWDVKDEGEGMSLIYGILEAMDASMIYAKLVVPEGREPSLPQGSSVWRRSESYREGYLDLVVTIPKRSIARLAKEPGVSVYSSTDLPGMARGIYSRALQAGNRETIGRMKGLYACFNPFFIGGESGVRFLTRTPMRSFGMIEATVAIPRVCTNAEGAVMLGYVEPGQVYSKTQDGHWWGGGSVPELLAGNKIRCVDCLERARARDDWDRKRADEACDHSLNSGWTRIERIGDARVVDEGSRSPSDTMEFEPGEQEIRVFDTGKIEIRRFVSMRQIRRRFGVGDRITFPWFDEKRRDVRVWPPGVDHGDGYRAESRYEWP